MRLKSRPDTIGRGAIDSWVLSRVGIEQVDK